MAKVKEMNLTNAQIWSTLLPYLEDNWTWPGGVVRNSDDGRRTFYIDEAKTIGIQFIKGSQYFSYFMGVIFKGTEYHNIEFSYNTTNKTFMIEITDTALIISAVDNSTSINAANCQKIMVCNGHNTNIDTDEQVLIYLGSKSSSNVSAIYASDVLTPVDNSEQNGNANVNSKYTALINLYNTKSNFVATDVYKSMFMELSTWSFGDVMLNGHRYRMSGSIFALDE